MEYNVIKIIDGLLISNTTTLEDQQFMINNKISHLVCWLSPNIRINHVQFEEIGLKTAHMTKNSEQLPSIKDIQTCISLIEESKDQYLCCLICCEDIVWALRFVVPYFVCRYGWAIFTAICFAQRRFDSLKIANFDKQLQILEEGLPRILAQIISHHDQKLKIIEWSPSFLDQYRTDDVEQQIIINTVKNTLFRQLQKSGDSDKLRVKKGKRIQWFDEMAKNSITAGQRLFANSRINSSLKKGPCLKNFDHRTSLKLTNADQLVIKQIIKDNKDDKIKKSLNKKMANSIKQTEFEDFQYLSLKQLSRTNFDDIKFRGSSGFQKRRNLKILKKENKKSNEDKNASLLKPIKKGCENSLALTFIKGVKTLNIQYR